MVYTADVQIIQLYYEVINIRQLNSLLISVIMYTLISYLLELPSLPVGLIFTVIGSQINILLPENYKHSLVILIPLLAFSIIYPLVFIPVSIGCLSGIFTGLISRNGCMLFYPFTKTTYTGPDNYLETGSKQEHAATVFLVVLATVSIIFSLYGTSILDDINTNQGINNYMNNHLNTTSNYKHNYYGENNSGYIHYVDINPAEIGTNKNITTTNTNNSTTTIISEYNPP